VNRRSIGGFDPERKRAMTLCPIAVVVGCRKCPAFRVCPLKTVIGDQSKEPPPTAPSRASRSKTKAKKG